ncbi:TolC family protein [Shewanella avicenniae]|uniref:TolC family protein n=1 Tax=Shewanella avicenniae TaxID=2814294 RepID=A0ABX7QP23_9GAMM|nr:TolC family protein [Shewanella avicenniae]QSX33226.1 TolC family protein [Shewanella avicenniae]
MKRNKIVCWLSLLWLPLAQATPVSLADAWQQLQQVSDKLAADGLQMVSAEAEQQAAKELYLPSLTLNGSYTRLEKPLELDITRLNPLASMDLSSLPAQFAQIFAAIPHAMFITPFTEQEVFNASLQAMWPIYTGGQITAAQGIRKAQLAEKQQQHELTRRELFTTLIDRYFAVTVSQSLVSTQQQLVASLTTHYQHALKMEQQGQIAKVERLNAEVALDDAKVTLASATRQFELAQIALRRLLHQTDANASTPMFVLQQAPSLPQVTELTLSQHPALKLLAAKEQQAKGLIDLENGKFKPTVYLFGNYTLYEDDSLLSQMSPDWMVGVGVRVPIISRDGRSGKVLAAKSALLQARYTKAQTTEDLSLLVDQSYRQMQQAAEEIHSLNTSRELAVENLHLRELAFNQGLATSVERVDAELKLSAVNTKQLAAQYRYLQAYAHLMAVSGQLDDFIGYSKQQEIRNAR